MLAADPMRVLIFDKEPNNRSGLANVLEKKVWPPAGLRPAADTMTLGIFEFILSGASIRVGRIVRFRLRSPRGILGSARRALIASSAIFMRIRSSSGISSSMAALYNSRQLTAGIQDS